MAETGERVVPRLAQGIEAPMVDDERLVVSTVTDGEQVEVTGARVERKGPTTAEANDLLRAYAKQFARPTIEALTMLEQTVRACRETLEADLTRLEDHSQAFLQRNEAAQRCLKVCTDAVQQLVDGHA